MLPPAPRKFYALQQRVNKTARNEVARLWRTMGSDFESGWRRVGPQIVTVISAAQFKVADAASDYLADLAEQTTSSAVEGEVNPRSLVGMASDGRPLDTLAYGSVVTSGQAYNAGASQTQALKAGGAWLDMMTTLQVADAARTATSIGSCVRPEWGGYTRYLNPPSCSRCAVLAGKWFKWNTGFQRHPKCFPAGVTVSGPSSEAATRRWYQGELVIFRTASGKELPVTGNHPILTDQGWIPANLLQVGDNVVRSLGGQGATALVVPDEQQTPTLIEDVWRSSGMVSLGEVPTAAEDFHGDGGHGEVDIVFADRLLWDRFDAPGSQLAHQEQFARRIAEALSLPSGRTGDELLHAVGHAPDGIMGGSRLRDALLGSHAPGADLASLGHVPDLDAGILQALTDSAASDPVSPAQRVLTFASSVRRSDVTARHGESSPRWDAPASPFSVETRAAYASRGQDLSLRLASQVATDRVVELRRVEWSGHVYNLTSSEGWYSANGLIVSNCDCMHVPTSNAGWAEAEGFIGNPDDAWRNGHVKDLTKTQRKALEDGADLSQIINARRGMSTTTTIKGTRFDFTLEGTTKRGVYGRSDVAAGAGYTAANVGQRGYVKNYIERRTQRSRITPETIYRIAQDRADAIRLLRSYGYILP